jgi:hypothetical protein
MNRPSSIRSIETHPYAIWPPSSQTIKSSPSSQSTWAERIQSHRPEISQSSPATMPPKRPQTIQPMAGHLPMNNEAVTPQVIQMMLHENKLLIKAIVEQQAAGRPQEAIL